MFSHLYTRAENTHLTGLLHGFITIIPAVTSTHSAYTTCQAQSALLVHLLHIIGRTSLLGSFSHCPHFPDEKTQSRTERLSILFKNTQLLNSKAKDGSAGCPTPEPVYLISLLPPTVHTCCWSFNFTQSREGQITATKQNGNAINLAGRDVQWYSIYGKKLGNIQQKYVYLSFDPTIPILRLYPTDTLPKI